MDLYPNRCRKIFAVSAGCAVDCSDSALLDRREDCCRSLTVGLLVVQGIATSIDALSVGFNMVDMRYSAGMAAFSALLIAVVTFFICFAGLYIGKKFGTRLANKASILGGAILVGIGFWIFFS